MQLVHFYLNFPGTTKEAFQFYETVFGTKIAMIQTFGETSFMPNAPEHAKNKIMHVQLPITEAVHLMGSDAVEGFGPTLKEGNNFRKMLELTYWLALLFVLMSLVIEDVCIHYCLDQTSHLAGDVFLFRF